MVDRKGEGSEDQPDLVTLRTEYATLSHQLAQLDVNKQAGQWARLYRQLQAAEVRLRHAEQETPPSPAEPAEYAQQQAAQASEGGAFLPSAESIVVDERHERLRAIAGDLIYWKGGLKVLRQAQLPKWCGYFKWQIEAQIEALQAAYARLRAESANEGGEGNAGEQRAWVLREHGIPVRRHLVAHPWVLHPPLEKLNIISGYLSPVVGEQGRHRDMLEA